MKESFTHDVRAVLAAPGKGLSLKRIFAASWYLLLGYLAYLILTYLALLYDGVSFDYIWQSYGPFPLRLFPFDALVAKAIHLLGIALAVIGMMLAILAPALITFEELRGNFFFSASSAIRLSFRRLATILLSLLSLAAFVGVVYLLGVVTGLAGRIPVLGGLVIGLLYIVPIFLTLVFTVFVVFVAIVGVVLLPVIVAGQKRGEVFDALLQLFTVIIREPLRFAWYFLLSTVLAKAASFVFAYLFYRAVQFSHLMLVHGGGERVDRMFNGALAMLPLNSPVVVFITTLWPGLRFGFTIERWGYGGDATPGAILLAISFVLLFVVVCGYMTSVVATGLARGYAVIRRLKDDYMIVDESPLEPVDDYANPSFQSEDHDPLK